MTELELKLAKVISNPNMDEINQLISDWKQSTSDINDVQNDKNTVGSMIFRISDVISGLKKGLQALEKSKKHNENSLFGPLKVSGNIDEAILSMQNQISKHEVVLYFLKKSKKEYFDKDKLKYNGMIKIFKYAEKIGLPAPPKQVGAGRGNKCLFFAFVEIITEKQIKEIRYHFSKYIKN